VEEGRASVLLADRWGRTPLDTALKAAATQVRGRPVASLTAFETRHDDCPKTV
jgi:hypothetical protein